MLALGLSGVAACPPKDRPAAADAGAPSDTPFALTPWDEAARDAAIAAGAAVLRKHQCARCHTVDAIEAPARPLHCTSCHVFLKGLDPRKEEWAKLEKKYGKGILERYQRNIEHLRDVPSLTLLGARVRGDWILAFLREPHDVRPLLGESMIRHALTADEITTLGRYFAAMARAPDPTAAGYAPPRLPPRPDAARLEEGRRVFSAKGCAGCHTFGNVDLGVPLVQLESARSVAALAPNLRHVRDRTRPEILVAWIMDPRSVAPWTTMPNVSVSRGEAEALRDFLLFADPALAAAPPPPSLEPPALLARPVPYEEMKERVLGRVCVHCHMNDHEKDPGPGNRGGLGFRGQELQLRTYEALVSGYVDATGKRVSALVPRPGERAAPLVLAMLRRRLEARRDQIAPFADHALPPYPKDGLRGMPLGLPTMRDEEIALLATWIAQGCKGPANVSGTPGVYDGYLVPDGPIARNEGCELRAPDKKRPAWVVETEKAAAAASASATPAASGTTPPAGPSAGSPKRP